MKPTIEIHRYEIDAPKGASIILATIDASLLFAYESEPCPRRYQGHGKTTREAVYNARRNARYDVNRFRRTFRLA